MVKILKINGFLLCISLIVCSCNENKIKKNNKNSLKQDSLTIRLEIKNYEKVELNANADSLTRNWPMYNSLKNEVQRLEDYTLQDVISNILSIESVVDSLQETMPKKIDTLPVLSRIKILNTKAKFMLELSKKQSPKLLKIKKIAEEYPLEFNALNIQLNELFIKMPEFE